MRKAIRTTLALVLGLALFSGMTMAQAAANKSETNKTDSKTEKDKSGHHNRLGKAAFWRHHKDADKDTKHAKVTPASSKQSQNKAQVKTASAKDSTAKKQESTKKQPKQATKTSKPAVKKAPVADKAKSESKAQDTKTALSK